MNKDSMDGITKVPALEKSYKISSQVLVKIRKQKHISQSQLARMTGISQSYISRIEGEKANLSLASLVKFVNAVGGKLKMDIK
jgi:transcriptional regulator with XRE-family HTH domain